MLTYPMEERGALPLYEYLCRRIRADILSGVLPAGTRLPSKRALAEHLRVSVVTVEGAYSQLEAEGYLQARPKRGFFVSAVEQAPPPAVRSVLMPETTTVSWRLDLARNQVDTARFPVSTWARLTRQVLSEAPEALLSPVPHQGLAALRQAIADDLRDFKGMAVSPEQIVIGAGAEYLYLLLAQLLGRDTVFAVEDPGYPKIRQVYDACGAVCAPIPLDGQGVELSALERSGAKALHISPNHQYPTGLVTPIVRRQALLRWAEDTGSTIIEDDYDSEFRYKGKPIPALQGYDAEDKVIYLGTFSKSIAPAIRLSYMVLPKDILKAYRKKGSFVNSTVSKVDQTIVQHFIEEGYYERHLNKTRALYKNRHDVLIEALKPLGDICEISGEHAGVHILLTFKNGQKERNLIEKAKKADIRVYGLSDYRIRKDEKEKATILLGYANMREEDIKEAVAILNQCWRK